MLARRDGHEACRSGPRRGASVGFVIPSIDMGSCSGSDLADGLVGYSCLLVTGHGVPDSLRRSMAAVTAAFFDLPEAEKARVRWPGTGAWRGWQPVYAGAAELTGDRTPDLVERFEAQELQTFAMWPERPAELRATWEAYYGECARVTSVLMERLAEGLDLPGGELGAWTDRQHANLCVNNYPAQPETPRPGQVRVGAHTDRGGITLLSADAAPGGLEVRLPSTGEWVEVTIPPDAYLVQVGDLFARWTNLVVHGNVHRVVNPPRAVAASARRQSVVYFHYPALDTVVTPAPACVTRSGRDPLPPLHTGEHLLRRQAQFARDEAVRTGELHGLTA
jgi:isopenicillin N synthase-like dioxygenase